MQAKGFHDHPKPASKSFAMSLKRKGSHKLSSQKVPVLPAAGAGSTSTSDFPGRPEVAFTAAGEKPETGLVSFPAVPETGAQQPAALLQNADQTGYTTAYKVRAKSHVSCQ